MLEETSPAAEAHLGVDFAELYDKSELAQKMDGERVCTGQLLISLLQWRTWGVCLQEPAGAEDG